MTLTARGRRSGFGTDVSSHGRALLLTGGLRLGLCVVLVLLLGACAREQQGRVVRVCWPWQVACYTSVSEVPQGPTAALGFDYTPETLEVWRVHPGSAATQTDAQATVQVGDRFVAVEGLTLRRAGDEERVLEGKQPGERVLVTVQRGSLQLTFPVVLQPRE